MEEVRKEEIIFTGFDKGWDCDLTVKLIIYPDGSMDLHRQTGSEFEEHTSEALKILKTRGIVLDESKPNAIGSTGYYQSLKYIKPTAATKGSE